MEVRPPGEDYESLVDDLRFPLATGMADLNEYNCLADDAGERTIDYKRDRIDDDTVLTLVVEDDGRFVAYTTGERRASPPIFSRGSDLRVDERYVVDAYRRRGLATELLEQLVDWGEDVGCETVSVSVDASDEPAMQFYEAIWFGPERHVHRRRLSSR